MFDSHWLPTELARGALGSEVVSAVPVRKHAGEATRREIGSIVGLFVVVLIVGRFFPLYRPIGPALISLFLAAVSFAVYVLRRSWAWRTLRGDTSIPGVIAVFFKDRVELHLSLIHI